MAVTASSVGSIINGELYCERYPLSGRVGGCCEASIYSKGICGELLGTSHLSRAGDDEESLCLCLVVITGLGSGVRATVAESGCGGGALSVRWAEPRGLVGRKGDGADEIVSDLDAFCANQCAKVIAGVVSRLRWACFLDLATKTEVGSIPNDDQAGESARAEMGWAAGGGSGGIGSAGGERLG